MAREQMAQQILDHFDKASNSVNQFCQDGAKAALEDNGENRMVRSAERERSRLNRRRPPFSDQVA